MNHQPDMIQLIEHALQVAGFAVLATEHEGQPHASLVAITPAGNCRYLFFATYRNTRKYRNLVDNTNVALFIDGRDVDISGQREELVLTALGDVEEVEDVEHIAALNAHLERHPDLESFLRSTNCALFRVTVHAYQVVRGIDDVRWWSLDDRVDTQNI